MTDPRRPVPPPSDDTPSTPAAKPPARTGRPRKTPAEEPAGGSAVVDRALAILDDIVGIVFIAVLFTTGIDGGMLALAALAVVLFGVLTHLSPRGRAVRLVMGVAVTRAEDHLSVVASIVNESAP